MSDQEPSGPTEEPVKSGGKKGLLIGILAAILLGAGGFYATYSGLVGASAPAESHAEADEKIVKSDRPGVAYVALEPLVVSLGRSATNRYLRFSAQLEVRSENAETVSLLSPRILDVLNGFLRAVESRDIEDPAAMRRLRAQMLRRVQVVTGEGLILDLLITEFVLN